MTSVDGSLFHYTDIGAVASIIKHKELWLTDVGFMNDSQELFDGISIIKSCFDSFLSDMEDCSGYERDALVTLVDFFSKQCDFGYDNYPLYSSSFSRANDLLSQWRAYGNFAVEFYDSKLECESSEKFECLYLESDKNNKARELVAKAIECMSSSYVAEHHDVVNTAIGEYFKIVSGVGQFKNIHFAAENEVRIVSWSGFGADKKEVKHRARGNCLIPYIVKSFDVEAIKAIHIGPIADQELAEKSLRSLLRSNDLEHISICRSAIPFRS